MAAAKQIRRDIPAVRVAAFIDHYIQTNYPDYERTNRPQHQPLGPLEQFAAETGLNARTIYRIQKGESTNVRFELVDDMLVALDREYLWHWGPEDGGFSDYYGDEPGPPAEPTAEQQRWRAVSNAKRYARKQGRRWQDVLRERALEERALDEAA